MNGINQSINQASKHSHAAASPSSSSSQSPSTIKKRETAI
jgi:hypothetical protein